MEVEPYTMYIPDPFKEEDKDKIYSLINAYSFATLISRLNDALIATHIPLLLDPQRGRQGFLYGHMAKMNPQWKGFDPPQEVLALFQGPHAYISPAWYLEESKVPKVPTWNYAVVHVYGIPTPIHDPERHLQIIESTVRRYESKLDEPYSIDFRDEKIQQFAKGAQSFEIEITKIEAKFKLSQNRGVIDQKQVIYQLSQSADQVKREVARLMKENLK